MSVITYSNYLKQQIVFMFLVIILFRIAELGITVTGTCYTSAGRRGELSQSTLH